MGRYADNFETACPLESLSWVTMTPAARLGRLASRFLKEEHKLKSLKEKGDWSVTAGVVKPWLLSIYEPPKGRLSSLMEDLLGEIERQRKVRKARAENRPWKWEPCGRDVRLRRISKNLYRLAYRNHDKKLVLVADQKCVSLATVAGILMALDVSPDANARVYMRHHETGRVKVVILDVRFNYTGGDESWNLTKALLKLAPSSVQRSLFGGHLITVDFDRDGFNIDGTFHEYQNVAKIVEGPKRALRSPKTCSKRPDDDSAGDEE